MKEETLKKAWALMSARGGLARARNLGKEGLSIAMKKAVAAREAKRKARKALES